MPTTLPKPAADPKAAVVAEIESLRQLVISSKTTSDVGPEALEAVDKLNALYQENKELFTPEDVRWLNVLRGTLGARLETHKPEVAHTKKAKRKGDQLDHCWRCMSACDERWTEMCPTCSSKQFQWRVCPVCQACGCQRTGTVLM